MAVRASIDLGTNTCLLLIAQCDEKGRVVSVISDNSTIVRLGEGVDKTHELQPQAMERTLTCLKRYVVVCKENGVDPISVICVGTSSSRDASNGKSFYTEIEHATGFKFRVLSGDDEAKYTFLGGLLPGLKPETSAVIDIGGGSTEIITPGGGPALGMSIDIGSVRYTERFLKSNPVTDEEFWTCQASIDRELEPAIRWREKNPQIGTLIAVAGTATTLAAWYLELPTFDSRKIDLCSLTRGDVHRQVEELKWRNYEERALLPGVAPAGGKGRADILLAGSLILWRAMELLDFNQVRVSTRGLRYGICQL